MLVSLRVLLRSTVPLALVLSAAGLLAAADPPAPFMKGVALGLFASDPKYVYAKELDEIRALGANYVSLVVNVNMDTIWSEGVYVAPSSPSPETISAVARGAHARGMSVFLFPIIYLVDVRPGKWRGTIDPPNWERWFDSYAKVMLAHAELAEKNSIELLLVGCEMLSSEKKRDLWLDLIARIRQRYHGRLIYSSNWDRLSKNDFVGQLDYLGSNGYFDLAQSNHPNNQELTWNWKRIRDRYDEWHAKFGKPLVFTEIGYPSVDGCSRDPWDYTTTKPVDLQEQALCYNAFFEAWNGVPYLKGAFIYNWWGEGGPTDRSYTPRGKPAEAVLREWFARLP